MYDLIIVGAGPAGLTAALYALRANKKVLILEAKCYGGQIVNAALIENYPGIKKITGFEFADNLYNQVKDLGGIFKIETVTKIYDNKKVVTSNSEYQAKAVIIATGVENKKLNILKEDYFVGRGLSYCATCDGNFFKNKVVAVVGGGNTALEDALYLSGIAKEVYLIHRRDSFRGENKYVEELKKKTNVSFILNSNIKKLYGDEKLEKIEIEKNDKEKNILNVDGLFIAVGQVPNNEIFKNVVLLDKDGYILSKDGVHTETQGIYVAGDNKEKTLRQLTTAIADGAIAAKFAIEEMK